MAPTRTLWTALAACALACSSGLPGPPVGPHPRESAIIDVVDYPPPPAQAEVVPDRPSGESCVWLDGHWEWVGRRWRWESGGWIVPPPGCHFAPPTMYWIGEELSYLRPHWYPENADELPAEKARTACAPPTSCGRPAKSYVPPGGS